jgi:hypothetical protein
VTNAESQLQASIEERKVDQHGKCEREQSRNCTSNKVTAIVVIIIIYLNRNNLT